MGGEGEEGGGEGVILLPVRGAELKLLPFCNQICKNYTVIHTKSTTMK